MGRGQAKSNEVPKTTASPCQSGILSPTPSLWAQQREQSKQRAKEESPAEQHYQGLLRAAWSPLEVNVASRTHLTHSPVCVGQSFESPPSFECRQTPTVPLSFAAQSGAGEVRYTLCPHIPSCRGASPPGRVFPSPQLLLTSSLPGRIKWRGVGRDGLQKGMQDGETTPDPQENGIFLHLL